ncbi:MAG: hypothetical protein K1X57_11205 [Gemmataceae bacterium]|nr:hypothetical protein [Gemmataceae bacterium]
MALAIYSKTDFPWAETYFKCRPAEPLGGGLPPLPVNMAFGADDINLELIIGMVGTSWSDWRSSLLIASHGTTEAIMMGLSFDRPQSLRYNDLKVLCKLIDTDENDQLVADYFQMEKFIITGIRYALTNFRRCGIQTLAVRACKIGNNDRYLLKLAELLNIQQISAPLYRDFFGYDLNPFLAKPGSFEKGAAKFKALKPWGAAPNRVLIGFEKLEKSKFRIHTAAESEKGILDFYKQWFQFQNPPIKWSEKDGLILFGIQKKPGEVYFPAHPQYGQLFRVINNPRYRPTEIIMPDLPMVPFKDDEQKKGGRLRHRLANVFRRNHGGI